MSYFLVYNNSVEVCETAEEAREKATRFRDYNDTYYIDEDVECVLQYNKEMQTTSVYFTLEELENYANELTQDLQSDKDHEYLERCAIYG